MKHLKGAILFVILTAVLALAAGAQVGTRTTLYQSTAHRLHLAMQKLPPLRAQQGQEPRRDVEGRELPPAGGALPLISVIGFGALVGGIASAMKAK